MKKWISISIFFVSLIALVLISIFCMHGKTVHYVNLGDKIFISTDNETFSYENEIIKFSRKDNRVEITSNFSALDRIVSQKTSDGTMIVFAVENHLFDVSITDSGTIFHIHGVDEMDLYNKYIGLITDSYYKENAYIENRASRLSINIVISLILSVCISILIIPSNIEAFSPNKKKKIKHLITLSVIFIASVVIYLLILLK